MPRRAARAQQGGVKAAQRADGGAAGIAMPVKAHDFEKRPPGIPVNGGFGGGYLEHLVQSAPRQMFANQQVGPTPHGGSIVGSRKFDDDVHFA
jgi:hypothetical protein